VLELLELQREANVAELEVGAAHLDHRRDAHVRRDAASGWPRSACGRWSCP
jgi:hypothetical protein